MLYALARLTITIFGILLKRRFTTHQPIVYCKHPAAFIRSGVFAFALCDIFDGPPSRRILVLAMLDLSHPGVRKTHCWTSQQWHPITHTLAKPVVTGAV